MEVYLLRHGIAHDREAPDCPPDAERPLVDKGRRRTRRACLGLRALGIAPQKVLSSPFLRARQTAEIAGAALAPGADIETTESLLPLADPGDLQALLSTMDAQTVLCTGHAPHLDRFIAHTCGAERTFTKLKKAGLAWLHIGGGQTLLHALLPPGTLRVLGHSMERKNLAIALRGPFPQNR